MSHKDRRSQSVGKTEFTKSDDAEHICAPKKFPALAKQLEHRCICPTLMLTLHTYAKCSTCRDAVKWLRAQGIPFAEHPIRDQPPSLTSLQQALADLGGDLRALFNTSGQDYRALGLKDRLPTMAADEALRLLSENGNLIKRPFAQDPERGLTLTGFKEAAWAAALA